MEVVESKDILEKQDLSNKIVFKKSFYGPYYIYNIKYFDDVPNNKLHFLNNIMKSYKDYNEVLLKDTPRKIYFDIDHKYNTEEELKKNKNIFIKEFENDLKKYIKHINNNINTDNIEILFIDASGFTNESKLYKLSLHIIVNNYGYFNNNNKLYMFISDFNKYSNKKYNNFIDLEVYNEFRLFRTVLSVSPKDGKSRRLKLINKKDAKFWDLFIGDHNKKNKSLDFLISENNIPPIKTVSNNYKYCQNKYIDLNILSTVMKKYDDIFDVYKFNNKKNIVSINRKKSSKCEICDTIHSSENAYLLFDKNKVSFGCHRNNSNKYKIVYNKDIPPIENIVNNDDFNNMLLVTLSLRKQINKIYSSKNLNIEKKNKIVKPVNIKKDNKNNKKYNMSRTKKSIEKYYQLGKDILNKKDTLINLVRNFGNEKNIYKVKTKALRVIKYLEVLKENIGNTSNINITLKKLFNMKKIEFSEYIKNIPLI